MDDLGIEFSFRIEHPKEDLMLAAEKLGIEPFRIWVAGAQRETPTGLKLDGRYDRSYCCLRPKLEKGLYAAQAIEKFLSEVEKHNDYWAELASSGGSFMIVIFNESDERYVDEFDWSLLKRLSKLEISLGFDC